MISMTDPTIKPSCNFFDKAPGQLIQKVVECVYRLPLMNIAWSPLNLLEHQFFETSANIVSSICGMLLSIKYFNGSFIS